MLNMYYIYIYRNPQEYLLYLRTWSLQEGQGGQNYHLDALIKTVHKGWMGETKMLRFRYHLKCIQLN